MLERSAWPLLLPALPPSIPTFPHRPWAPAAPQVTHARCFWSWGGTFVVHPRAFLVHVPHERSSTYHSTYANNWEQGSKVRRGLRPPASCDRSQRKRRVGGHVELPGHSALTPQPCMLAALSSCLPPPWAATQRWPRCPAMSPLRCSQPCSWCRRLLCCPPPLPQFGALYWQLQKDLVAGNYTPVVGFAAERCDLTPPVQQAAQQEAQRAAQQAAQQAAQREERGEL